ncbi:hypothetical protein OPQ81_004904 [Rhizoctonia solani]|nr:hypothetical protein OPQ81_004904 [Rhizoctonia solani]
MDYRTHLASNLFSTGDNFSGEIPYMRPPSRNLERLQVDPDSDASVYSGETAVYSSPGAYSAFSTSQLYINSATTVHKDVNISLVDGHASFDRVRDGVLIAPRLVREMQCDSPTLTPALSTGGGIMGDFAYSGAPLYEHTISPHASISFENGIDYQAVVDVRRKMSRLYTIPTDEKMRALRTAEFAEMLTLHISQGVGLCTPQELCEIWPSLPTFDRRLFGLCWYEMPDGSGAEFLVLLINGSSDLSSYQDWWVRLERIEMSDHAAISTNSNAVIYPGSELKHKMTFSDGLLFEKVIDVLRSVPIGSNPISEDCWFYASIIAHKLSMEVEGDLGECSVMDLREIWGGERGSHMLVNRIQFLRESGALGTSSEFLLLNISQEKYGRRGLWVRLGKGMYGEEDRAFISQNRRRLMGGTDSDLITGLAFEVLKFGDVMSAISQANREMNAKGKTHQRGLYHVVPHEVVEKISQRREYVCWIKGN